MHYGEVDETFEQMLQRTMPPPPNKKKRFDGFFLKKKDYQYHRENVVGAGMADLDKPPSVVVPEDVKALYGLVVGPYTKLLSSGAIVDPAYTKMCIRKLVEDPPPYGKRFKIGLVVAPIFQDPFVINIVCENPFRYVIHMPKVYLELIGSKQCSYKCDGECVANYARLSDEMKNRAYHAYAAALRARELSDEMRKREHLEKVEAMNKRAAAAALRKREEEVN